MPSFQRAREAGRRGAVLAGFIAACVCAHPAIAATPLLTVLHTFSGPDGESPHGKPVEGPDGAFYGTTLAGGSKGGGTVYRITKSGVLTTLHEFSTDLNDSEGNSPVASLIVASDGNLYGSTESNLGSGYGTLFRINLSTLTFASLYAFNGADGTNMFAPLMEAADGNLYGITYGGPAFRLGLDGTLSLIPNFNADGSLGAEFVGGFLQGPDGTLYGTAHQGGGPNPNQGGGTVFSMTPAGVTAQMHSFTYAGITPEGSWPVGGLIFGADGALYGVNGTDPGGGGAIFRIDLAGNVSQVYGFGCSCGSPQGAWPDGTLILASDGNFYGVTTGGGTTNNGIVFSVSPAGVFTSLHSFDGAVEGSTPLNGVIEASDGRFYGVTGGGVSQKGNVWKLTLPPAAPGGVTATSGANSITVRWNAVRTANTYTVSIGTSPGGESAATAISGITGTNTTFLQLTSGTTYYVHVVAVNESGAGGISPEASAVPTAPPSHGGGGSLDLGTLLLGILALTVRKARLRSP